MSRSTILRQLDEAERIAELGLEHTVSDYWIVRLRGR